jgi:hypothetical protein
MLVQGRQNPYRCTRKRLGVIVRHAEFLIPLLQKLFSFTRTTAFRKHALCLD